MIKRGVKEFFKEKFQRQQGSHPQLDGVHFRSVSTTDNAFICSKFELEEIKGSLGVR